MLRPTCSHMRTDRQVSIDSAVRASFCLLHTLQLNLHTLPLHFQWAQYIICIMPIAGSEKGLSGLDELRSASYLSWSVKLLLHENFRIAELSNFRIVELSLSLASRRVASNGKNLNYAHSEFAYFEPCIANGQCEFATVRWGPAGTMPE